MEKKEIYERLNKIIDAMAKERGSADYSLKKIRSCGGSFDENNPGHCYAKCRSETINFVMHDCGLANLVWDLDYELKKEKEPTFTVDVNATGVIGKRTEREKKMSILSKQYIPIADGKYLLRSTEHEKHIKTIIEEELPNGYEPISLTYSENVIPGSDYYYVLMKRVEKKQTKEQKLMDIIKNP